MHYLKPKIHANHDHIYAKSVKKGNNIIYKVHEGPFLWFSWLFWVAIIRSYTSSSSSSSTTSSSRRQNDKVGSFNFRMNIDDALATFHHMIHLHPLPFVVEFNKLLSAIVRMGHYETVITLSKQMELAGISHNVYTLSILINCFSPLNHVDLASLSCPKSLNLVFNPISSHFRP